MEWPNLTIGGNYITLLQTTINDAINGCAKMFKNQTTGDFVDQIRYNSALKRLEYWTGSAWAALDISTTGIAAASIAAGTITATLVGSASSATSATNASGTGTAVKSGSENGLRIVRGDVSSGGIKTQGVGFTAIRNSVGSYTVTFSPVFGGVPTVTISSDIYDRHSTVGGTSASVFGLVSRLTITPTTFADAAFSFIAIGPN